MQQEVTIKLTIQSDERVRFEIDHSDIDNSGGIVLLCLGRGMVEYASVNTQRLISLGELAFEKDAEEKTEFMEQHGEAAINV